MPEQKPAITAGIQIEVTQATAMRLIGVALVAIVGYFLLEAAFKRILP